MSAPSAKSLFQATKPKDRRGTGMFGDNLHEQAKPREARDPLDFDPTPEDATEAFLSAESGVMRGFGNKVWEPAVGAGHIARPLMRAGFEVVGNDVVDRGWPSTTLRSFYDYDAREADIIVTNPPYNQINARDGHGRWLRHTRDLGVRYCAMLLNWDWYAARQNGMDELHHQFPPARVYLCCWKIDFRGLGSPPQRNGWYVWDAEWRGETVLRRLFRDGPSDRQPSLI